MKLDNRFYLSAFLRLTRAFFSLASILALSLALIGCGSQPQQPDLTHSADTTATDSSRQIAVTVVVIEGLNWTNITSRDTPTLYQLTAQNGVANLAVNHGWVYQNKLGETDVALAYYNIYDSTIASIDAQIAELYQADNCLIIIASRTFTGSVEDVAITNGTEASDSTTKDTEGALVPAIIAGAGFNGYLESSSTRRAGLLSGSDIENYVYDLKAASEQKSTPRVVLTVHNAPEAAARLSFLQHNAAICDAVTDSKEGMNLAFLALFLATTVLALALMFFEIDVNPRYTRWLVPVSRGLLLITCAYPIATFLMFLIPPMFYAFVDTTLGLVAACAFWTAILVVVAVTLGKLGRWVFSLFFLLIVAFSVILLDQLLGGPLSLTGYLNYQADQGTRYYGLGNESAALLFGSWITFSGLLVNRFPAARWAKAFKRWGFALASTAIIVICAIPQIGSSFGVLVWAPVGCFVAWWLFLERPLRLRFILGVTAASFLLGAGVLTADLALNPYSHLDNMGGYVQGGPIALFFGVFNEIRAFSWTTVVYSPILTLVFVIVVLLMFILALAKPGSYKEFWTRNRGFRAVYTAGLAIMILMCFFEDSGIFMPALYMAYLLPGFIWLVCDMHTWRSRIMQVSGEPITLRKLMRLALDQETYRARFIEPDTGDGSNSETGGASSSGSSSGSSGGSADDSDSAGVINSRHT